MYLVQISFLGIAMLSYISFSDPWVPKCNLILLPWREFCKVCSLPPAPLFALSRERALCMPRRLLCWSTSFQRQRQATLHQLLSGNTLSRAAVNNSFRREIRFSCSCRVCRIRSCDEIHLSSAGVHIPAPAVNSAAPVRRCAVRCSHDTIDEFNLNEMAFQVYSSNFSSAMPHTVCRTSQLRDTGPSSPCNMDGIPGVLQQPQAGHELLCSAVLPCNMEHQYITRHRRPR